VQLAVYVLPNSAMLDHTARGLAAPIFGKCLHLANQVHSIVSSAVHLRYRPNKCSQMLVKWPWLRKLPDQQGCAQQGSWA
jgi:hypothetical protein